MTHLRVAECMLSLRSYSDADAAAFLLGSIAPDAVHYRNGFTGADKKITHLCPVSGERWGQVSDNNGWILSVKRFYRERCRKGDDAFAAGYCAHILTDIYNNIKIWIPFRTQYPEMAAQGYSSAYYEDWGRADTKLYQSLPEDNAIERLLPNATGRDVYGYEAGSLLVTAKEIHAIRDNVLYESYPNKPIADPSVNRYMQYEQVTRLVTEAAVYAGDILFT